jgi:hypothetical protein
VFDVHEQKPVPPREPHPRYQIYELGFALAALGANGFLVEKVNAGGLECTVDFEYEGFQKLPEERL